MADFIEAAALIKYNANSRGNDVGDCVCRTISWAFDISYSEASKQLNKVMREKHWAKWNISPVYNVVIKQNGGGDPISYQDGEYPTVEDFADSNNSGCFIILCGKNDDGPQHTHMVCTIDGKIYDSWDSRKWYVKKYYPCSPDRHVAETDLQSHMRDLSTFARDFTMDELSKYCLKWLEKDMDLDWHIELISGLWEGLLIHLTWKVDYTISDDDHEEEKSIRFKTSYPLKPGMSEEDAKAFIQKTAKQRAYDRMYVVRENAKKDVEAFEMTYRNSDPDAPVANQSYWYTTPQEERFLKQLPGKVRPFIAYFRIYDPGQHSNSYEIRVQRMPGDPRKGAFTIEAYDAAAAKDMVRRYVENFERPYEDYSPYEEY